MRNMRIKPLSPNPSRLKASAMLAAALGSMSAPAVISTTGILSFIAEDATAQASDSDTRAKAQTLRLLSKAITLDVEDQPLEDVLNYIMDVTEAELEPVYLDSLSSTGMDPDTLISLRVNNVPAITVLERVLKKAERIEAIGEEYTWQFTDIGTIECGPKSVLNINSRIELYDIADLIMAVPDFDNAPDFNISSNSGGGGGGSSPFSGSTGDVDIESSAERANSIINLIQTSVEPNQWANAGGDGATLTVYGTSIVVTAPDYIHRQIVGYEFWPARLQTIRAKGDQRWIQIKPDPKFRSIP
ncbi:MAG: hypothetical protein JJ974_12475 [Phycisphaerales bacterium]|nr:hypothetical protein [Phycisphaerales bacterium]